jgi:phosphocarrier protein
MQQTDIVIPNKLGLHARAAAKFVNLASQFKSEITLTRNGQDVNGKSIMGIMMLAAGKGSKLQLSADGADEQSALVALRALIDNRFGEDE